MKSFLALILVAVFSIPAFAQTPQQIKYQGVARDAAGAPIANGTITVQFDVHDVTPLGTIIYTETHTGVTTNQFGLFSLSIGSITPFPANMFGTGDEFLEVSVDFGSGLTSMGTSQFLSVPYAIYAETSGSSTPGPQGPTGPQGTSGTTGPQGPSGDPGATGAQGPIGNDGPTGPQGIAGATGPAGTTGANGATGAQGPAGATGAAGTNGTNGATGATGPQGVAGATGTNGANGATGPTGATGVTGTNGTNGATGPTGPQGTTGAAGTNGATGPTGLLAPGSSAGNTPYWNGTQWVTNSSNIYNNGGSVGMGTTTPNTSAILDLSSTTQAFLPPRMTEAQRNAISSPGPGMVIFNTTTNCLNVYESAMWKSLCGSQFNYPPSPSNYTDPNQPVLGASSACIAVGGSNNETAVASQIDGTGRLTILTSTGVLFQMDPTGIIRRKRLISMVNTTFVDFAITNDGGYVLVGKKTAPNNAVVTKLDSNMLILWCNEFSNIDEATGVTKTSDGGVAVVGYTNDINGLNNDAVVLKINSSGTLLWSRANDCAPGSNNAKDITESPDLGLIVHASFIGGGGYSQLFKLNASGAPQWVVSNSHNTFTSYDCGAQSLCVDYAGNIFVVGTTTTSVIIQKHNSAGGILFSKSYAVTPNQMGIPSIRYNPIDSTLLISGSESSVGWDGFVLKADLSGNVMWSKKIGSSSYQENCTNAIARSTFYYVIGNTDEYGYGLNDVLISKLDVTANSCCASNETFTVTAVTTPSGNTTSWPGFSPTTTGSAATVSTPTFGFYSFCYD